MDKTLCLTFLGHPVYKLIIITAEMLRVSQRQSHTLNEWRYPGNGAVSQTYQTDHW